MSASPVACARPTLSVLPCRSRSSSWARVECQLVHRHSSSAQQFCSSRIWSSVCPTHTQKVESNIQEHSGIFFWGGNRTFQQHFHKQIFPEFTKTSRPWHKCKQKSRPSALGTITFTVHVSHTGFIQKVERNIQEHSGTFLGGNSTFQENFQKKISRNLQ